MTSTQQSSNHTDEMKLTEVLTPPLPKECLKAARIFRSFVDDGNNGLDGLIPREVLASAKGFAILTVLKAGALFSARGGSGIVIARLEDDSWSPPSAIGIGGLGFGGQFGAEMAELVIVLNTRSSIRSFMTAGSLTLGGNVGIAVGPTGRNTQVAGAVNTNGVAAMYSYSRSKGLYGGISFEGSVIMERQDANVKAYNSPVTVRMILSGVVKRPDWATPLIETIEECTSPPSPKSASTLTVTPDSSPIDKERTRPRKSPLRSTTSLFRRKQANRVSFPPSSWGAPTDGGSYFTEAGPHTHSRSLSSAEPLDFSANSSSASDPGGRSEGKLGFQVPSVSSGPELPRKIARKQPPKVETKTSSKKDLWGPSYNFSPPPTASNDSSSRALDPLPPKYETLDANFNIDDNVSDIYGTESDRDDISHSRKVQALFDFDALQEGDLSFKEGDVIEVTKKTNSIDDWWTGRTRNGRTGIFPANYVTSCK